MMWTSILWAISFYIYLHLWCNFFLKTSVPRFVNFKKTKFNSKKVKIHKTHSRSRNNKKMVFMSDNWLTLGILTFSSWNNYNQISLLTLKNNCDNITSTKAFYIKNETGEERKRRKRTLILVKSKSATRGVSNKGVQKNLGNPLKKAMSEIIFEWNSRMKTSILS